MKTANTKRITASLAQPRSWVCATFFLTLILIVSSTANLRAQVDSASLSGVVQDQTGAIVPGAKVTIQNASTGVVRTSQSNGSGLFAFEAIPSGDYKLTVQQQGFKQLVRTDIHLNPGDSLAIPNLSLAVGATSESVTVGAETATLPLDSGQLSATINSDDLDRLSIVGRDATELQRTLPGFAIRNLDSTNSAPDFSQVQVGQPTPYSSNGSPVAGITLKMDGANLTDAGSFGAGLENINDSFVSEVQVQTSNFGADQSNGPVVITGVTKAGTDKYHGSLYTFARTSQLNSNDWLAKYNGIARPDDRFVYPGGTIGGPIPHFNKLTFFAGAEYDAQRNIYAYGSSGSAIIHALVPTMAMRTGDFSSTALSNYLGPMLTNGNYGTFNTPPTVGDNGSTLTNGNIAAFLNPGAMALVNGTLPLPTRTQTGTDGFNYDALNLTNNNVAQFTGRMDYNISPRNQLFGRYSFEKQKQGQPETPYYSPAASSVMGGVDTPGYGVDNDIWVHSAAANYVTIFTPTLTNELYATLTSFVESFDAREIASLQKTAIQYPYNGAFANKDTQYPQFGTYTTYGGLPLGLWPDYSLNPLQLKKLQPNVGDNLTKVWGKETIKVGIFSQRTVNNQTATNPQTNGVIQDYYYGGAGSYFADYNGTYPDGSPAYGNPHFNSGNALANFFEGQIQDWHQQNFNPYTNLYFWNVDVYAQDTWRATSNLVVTIGGRIAKLGAWQDAHGVGAAIWNPALYTSTYNATTNPLPGITWHQLTPSIPNAGISAPPIYFEPRVGFSWDVLKDGKTVVRGGFGVYRFHDSVVDVTSEFGEAEHVRYTDLQGFGDNTLEGVNTLNLNPNTYGNAGGTETYISPATIYGLDPKDNKEPVTNNYSLSIARQMPGNWILQASYAGNNTNSMMDNGTTQAVVLDNVNAIPVGTLFTATAATAINAKAGYNACNPTGCTPQQAASLDNIYNYPGDKAIQNARPFPNYSQILQPEHNTYANYNGLQIEAIKHVGRLNFNANYSWSKALGILGSSADFNWTAGIDPFNLRNNYGPLNFDRSQVLNLSYSYQTGKFTDERLLGGFINQWLISGITNVQSGPNMQTGVSASPGYYVQGNIGSGGNAYPVESQSILGTPDVNLQPVLTCSPRSGLAAHQYLNPACFALPALGTNGQYIEPYAHGPAFFNSDLTLEKGFRIGEKDNLRFRIAGFNFLNHPLNSFGTGYASQTTLQLSDTSANATPQTATYNPASGFGSAPQKLGRRLLEVSAKFSF
ncbi:MAG: carboxypeptidase-like regulatory domain-containing protein [Terracidiphilus sp.]